MFIFWNKAKNPQIFHISSYNWHLLSVWVRLLQKQVFFKMGDVLKYFANFVRTHSCWSLFLIKLQASRPATLLKRDFNTGAFLWNFSEHFFLQNTSSGCFCYLKRWHFERDMWTLHMMLWWNVKNKWLVSNINVTTLVSCGWETLPFSECNLS